ncbi:Bcp Peroxiredoxin [Methylophilaceae bacterium]
MIKLLLLAIALAGLLVIVYLKSASSVPLKVGVPAPTFSLLDQSGQLRTFDEFKGRWLVLYFYPKDNTPGCTKEACHFRDDHSALQQYGANVVGISVDSPAAHAQFANKYRLPFPLLADTSGLVAKSYGALINLGWLKLAKRHTFLIDSDGKVAKVYVNVDPNSHSDTLLSDLKALQE